MSPYVLEVLCRCLYLFYLHDRLQRLLRSCYSHFHVVFATFFFFFYVVFYYLLQKSHVDVIGSSKVCLYPTVRRPRILHRLLLRSGGVKNPEQIFFSSLSLCNALFLLMGLPYCSTTLTTGYIIPILEERN